MEFRLSPDEEAFRAGAADWLRANLPADRGTPACRMPGDLAGRVELARAWQRKLAAGGWAGLHWPRAHGGRDASPIEQLLFVEECIAHDAPTLAELGIGMSLVGPVLIRHGSDAQRARFLPHILTAGEIWCQGFSEPGAGSDLAGIHTRAERRGDTWVVTGQKVWTSYAQLADWCILLVRTDPAAARHRGLSLLLVDMRSPGITVRPLVEMTGAPWFNEVFFDGVVVPADRVVGAVDDGCAVAMTTLGHERTVASPPLRLGVELQQVLALAGAATGDPHLRQRLAQAAIDARIVRLLAYRQVSTQMRSGRVGPEGSCERDRLLRMLEHVEGMPLASLRSGVQWTWQSIPEYLTMLRERPLGLNVAALIGHSSLRAYVLGDEAYQRAATADEIAAMAALVREAMAAGALGFATSLSPGHVGAGGRPVPSRLATRDELRTLVHAMAASGRGVLEITPRPFRCRSRSAISCSSSRAPARVRSASAPSSTCPTGMTSGGRCSRAYAQRARAARCSRRRCPAARCASTSTW